MSQRAWVRPLVVLLVVYSLAHVAYSIIHYNPISFPYASGDFGRAYREMLNWQATGVLNPQDVLHPPLYYVLLRPFAPLEFSTVTRILYFSQFLWYGLAIVLMVKAASGASKPSTGAYLLATLLMVNFQPFLETVAMHKVEGLELLLICLAIYLFMKRRDALSGAVVVLGANLKYLPGILGLYFLVKRETRVLAGMLVALGLSLVVGLVVFSGSGMTWASVVTYPLALLLGHQHEGNRPEASIEMQTLSGTVNRWMVGSEGMLAHFKSQTYVAVSDAGLALSIAAVLKLACVGVYLYVVGRRWRAPARSEPWPVALCELSLTLIMIFVIAQASRVHYAILLLPAFVSAALLLYRYPDILGWPERILFAVAYGLTAMLIPGGALNWLPPHPLWGPQHSYAYLWFSLPFWGYMLLACCLLRCRARLLASEVAVTGQGTGR